uniref:Ubiquinol-cytochrome c reductase complex assembly factor 4 n=1 Tax=Sparus aurata TaxID=8175 RepID=A0A671WJM5_SPAAU
MYYNYCIIHCSPSSSRCHHHSVSLQRTAKSADDEEEVKSEPIKFSTSKASHKSWRVEGSMGSQYQRPWWKVLPVSLFGMIFLLWCALRKESDIDSKLEENLYEPTLMRYHCYI